eukprot:g37118.t1
MTSLLPTAEFTSAILTAVYIPPHGDMKNALDMIYTTTNTRETNFPEALFIAAGGSNQANLKQLMPKSCVDQLVEVFTNIFNLSLLQAIVPTCFKKITIIPVPRKAHAMCLNDYHPLALTSIIMKKKGGEHGPNYINRAERERVERIKFLRVTITDHLSWNSHMNATVKTAQQCLFFLKWLRKFGMSITSLTNFYRCTTVIILSGCIMAWYGNCSSQDCKKLQKVVCTSQTITEANLPSMDCIYTARCWGKAANIIKVPSHH